MSGIIVSELGESEVLNNDDILMIVQNGLNKKIKAKNVKKVGTKVLFENEEGLNDNITLSQSIANFSEVRIDYKIVFSTAGYTNRQSIITPIKDGDSVALQSIIAHTDTLMLFNSGRYKISGNTITKQVEIGARIDNTNVIGFDGKTSRILITKVTGYNI